MARLYIKTPWSYETDSWSDVTSVKFNSRKVHEDKIFERQDILQFLSHGTKYYKYVKSPNHDTGTLNSLHTCMYAHKILTWNNNDETFCFWNFKNIFS